MQKLSLNELAKRGYRAYVLSCGNSSYNGSTLPTWEELGERQQHWKRFAEATFDNVKGFITSEIKLYD